MTEKMFIAYNDCYGGFSLSDLAIERYAELKDIKLYPEKNGQGDYIFYIVPPKERDTKKYNHGEVLYDRDICRHDPVLTKVIKEIGEKANGMCADIKLTEVNKGTVYKIKDYDGLETIHYRYSDEEWVTAI